ncbi:hypothetical protein EC23916_1942 [Escherichia coli 2.3916]|nr:hypothetical protein EC23916_1942 [Escherichia coli 2.3916]
MLPTMQYQTNLIGQIMRLMNRKFRFSNPRYVVVSVKISPY